MGMYKIEFLVREIDGDEIVALYVSSDLELPFVPAVGMQFKQGNSTWLWETGSGELMPQVETVTYDLDENLFVCLFTVNKSLKSSFWTKIESEEIDNSSYLAYFNAR